MGVSIRVALVPETPLSDPATVTLLFAVAINRCTRLLPESVMNNIPDEVTHKPLGNENWLGATLIPDEFQRKPN